MSSEVNIFPITNLKDLHTRYNLFLIRGLDDAPTEYYQNIQHIISKLSYSLRSPVTVIHQDGKPYLVLEETKVPPKSLQVTRTIVRFEKHSETLTLDYTLRSHENDAICMRFLDFAIQGYLFGKTELWQPQAGRPFYEKTGEEISQGIIQHIGYSIRSTLTPDGLLGFCVDVTSKLTSKLPLSAHLTPDEFSEWQNRTFVYHYGHSWYEVQLNTLSSFHASEYFIPDSGKSILQWSVDACKKPIPQELANVPHDAAVGIYLDNRGESRGALIPLCYPLYRTHDSVGRQNHNKSILPPQTRRKKIRDFLYRYLTHVPFGGDGKIRIEFNSSTIPTRIFAVPDLKFGHNQILSTSSTPNARHTSLDSLGQTRLSLLQDNKVGFYSTSPLGRHYLILPQTVYDSFGEQFKSDLTKTVNNLYSQPYAPIVVTYDDRVPKTYPKQGNAILTAVKEKCELPGYAVVMIHHTTDQKSADEDELAAMVMRELRKEAIDIKATVIHSATGQECYELVQSSDTPFYRVHSKKRGKLNGYLRMVAINKILLNNEIWPFLLETRLHADLTIGLDVKHNTAGLVVVGKNGGEINTLFKTSRQKEKLLKDQIKAYLVDIIRTEVNTRSDPISRIVLQRDGRVFDTEIEGANEAVKYLVAEGVLADDADITIIEIPKSSPVRLRIFDITDQDRRNQADNPQVGTYCTIGVTEGYVCATGRAFPKPGTVRPLHVKLIQGKLSIEECLEDVFFLTCLAWTRPDDATRYPITIKLNDRYLGEEASDYDANILDIDAILDEKEELELSYE